MRKLLYEGSNQSFLFLLRPQYLLSRDSGLRVGRDAANFINTITGLISTKIRDDGWLAEVYLT